MLDWTQVTNRIAVGGHILSQKDMDVLVNYGITHILNMQQEINDEDYLGNAAHVEHRHLKIPDDGSDWNEAWVSKQLTWCLDALAEHPINKLYIHCAAGLSRSPSMVYGVLRAFGLDPSLAENLVIKARPNAFLTYKSSIERSMRKYYEV